MNIQRLTKIKLLCCLQHGKFIVASGKGAQVTLKFTFFHTSTLVLVTVLLAFFCQLFIIQLKKRSIKNACSIRDFLKLQHYWLTINYAAILLADRLLWCNTIGRFVFSSRKRQVISPFLGWTGTSSKAQCLLILGLGLFFIQKHMLVERFWHFQFRSLKCLLMSLNAIITTIIFEKLII